MASWLLSRQSGLVWNISLISFEAQRRCGWAKFPDFEVIYIYDKGDENFGYAINLSDITCSEWGYAPFTNE
jgi:hypothetical protein